MDLKLLTDYELECLERSLFEETYARRNQRARDRELQVSSPEFAQFQDLYNRVYSDSGYSYLSFMVQITLWASDLMIDLDTREGQQRMLEVALDFRAFDDYIDPPD